jgi:hypothetical protein
MPVSATVKHTNTSRFTGNWLFASMETRAEFSLRFYESWGKFVAVRQNLLL